MSLLSNPSFLKAFAALNTISIALLAGAALSMYFFSIPVILQAKTTSSAIMLRQFHHLITLGGRYLQGGCRILGVFLVALIYLLYRHPDEDVAGRWKYFAAALFTVVQVAWYEVVFVFPINDRLVEMEGELAGADKEADLLAREEVLRLLEEWRFWHVGRIVIPLVAVGFATCGLLF